MLLQTDRLTKTFSNFMALNEVTIDIPDNRLTAIIGPNGAGKTTLINVLTGRLIPDRGKILFHGEDITAISTNERVRRGIGRSFQITNIFPHLTVLHNVMVPALAHAGKSLSMIRGLTSLKEVYAYADKILKQVGLEAHSELLAGQLSHGDQRKLEIALALTTEPHLLILDEPTAGMNPVERREMLKLLSNLVKSSRITLLLVEHDMDVVFNLAEHIIVLDYGSVLAEGSPQEIKSNSQVVDIYLGKVVAGDTHARKVQLKPVSEELLKVKEINTYYGLSHALHDVSFEVRSGETVTLLGRNGVGKTTTLRSLMGINPARRGSIQLRGEDITRLPPYLISSRGVGYVPDDRRIFPTLSTLENLMMPLNVHKKRNSRWTVEKVVQIFPPLEKVMDRKGRFLSGGEQKMLSIGRALMLDPVLLLLDEPSEGLSPLVVQFLFKALNEIKEGGMTALVADQNLNFAYEIGDRAYILDKGAIAYSGSLEALWEDKDTIKKYLTV